MENNYKYRFELRPGKYVFIPTEEGTARGKKIANLVVKKWSPSGFFYHFQKRGGHVAALRPHVDNKFKASIDLTNFFTSVTRTQVQRALKSLGFGNRYALDLATESCVDFQGLKFLPYGFVQSMVLATLVVEKSLLGQKISQIRGRGGNITMYVDDILVSGSKQDDVQNHIDEITSAAIESGFSISAAKSSPVGQAVTAFNCNISEGEIRILDDRMKRFVEYGIYSSDASKDAILRYVGVLNESQEADLRAKFY